MIASRAWLVVVGLAAGGLVLTPAAADAAKKKKADQVEALFKKLDANADGKVSSAEFAKLPEVKAALKADKKKAKAGTAAKKTKKAGKKAGKKGDATAALFKKLDANNDGNLTTDEFKKITEAQAAAKKAKKAK